MKPFLTLKSVDEVLAAIWSLSPLASEIAGLDNACGRWLAKDIYAPASLPGFTRATVDGYAVAARDVFGASETSPALLQLKGACRMGEKPDYSLAPGQLAPILTGAMLPGEADCAVMLEYTRPAGDGLVEVLRSQAPGDNIVGPDEDAAKGSLLVPAGKRLRPQETGCLAAFGITEIPVYRKPEVVILSTGDEIVPPEATPGPAQVRDVNLYSISALCAEICNVKKAGIVPDDPQKLRAELDKALATADVLLLSGGSSAGARDFTLEAFMAVPGAKLVAHGVAISPGKPFILVSAEGKILAGLPGHVSGALICARVFILPILQRLQGAVRPAFDPYINATLTRSIASAPGRREYIRVTLAEKAGIYEATPLAGSSAIIAALVEAAGLVICPENRDGLAKGEKVRVYPV